MEAKPRWSQRMKILSGLGFLSIVVIVILGVPLVYWYARGGPIGSTGLKVILCPLQDEFRLGEPMRFRIEVQAMGWKSVTRDFQDYQFCHDVYEIRGPEGEKLPDAGGVGQSCGGPIRLLPFQTLLARQGDILLKYSIVEEGGYTNLSRGHPEGAGVEVENPRVQDHRPGRHFAYPASSMISSSVCVRPGSGIT